MYDLKDSVWITLFCGQVLPVVLLLGSNKVSHFFCGVFFFAILLAFFTTGIGKYELVRVWRATLRIERKLLGSNSD